MDFVTKGCEPEGVLRYFEMLSAIPRGSGNEKAAADFVCDFAKRRGLWFYRDKANNVLIRKEATEGFENVAPVILQGHLDMVCEKNAQTEHDFLTDPIKVRIENGWLTADGTTLGADDGAAVAMMLAVLDDASISHPTLECLFTTDEEKGMTGAKSFDYRYLKSRRMINIDSEDEGVAVISSAGGEKTGMTLECTGVSAKNKFMSVTVKGLAGGHSGNEINKNRMNAVKLMGDLLSYLYEIEPFEICLISGGGLDNAIPRECFCVLSVLDVNVTKERIKQWEQSVRATLTKSDKAFRVLVSKHRRLDYMLTYRDTHRVISLLELSPNGVLSMSPTVNGLVESSCNVGSVATETDGGKITVRTLNLYRSCVNSLLDKTARCFDTLAYLLECKSEHSSRYSGWLPKSDSPLQALYLKTYRALFGKEARLEAIHAGLECGIISSAIPDMDIISIGPDMCDIHSPDERMSIESLNRTYKLLLGMLAEK
ncbi:MAG: aminoacyl-histidine dipeptidase [Clostridia bacterium]|nr:aminoacyl-histidine dipeptidase [Clostridia bacterium]